MTQNSFPKFNHLLDQVFDLVKLSSAEKKRMIENYNEMVVNEMTNLILAYEGEQRHLFDDPQLIDQLTTDPKAIEQSMRGLFDKINKDLSEESKAQFYLLSKLTIFLQLIEPIIKNSSKEDIAKIGKILSTDEKFLEAFTALNAVNENLTKNLQI